MLKEKQNIETKRNKKRHQMSWLRDKFSHNICLAGAFFTFAFYIFSPSRLEVGREKKQQKSKHRHHRSHNIVAIAAENTLVSSLHSDRLRFPSNNKNL